MSKIRNLWARIRALFGHKPPTPKPPPPEQEITSPLAAPGAPAWGARLSPEQRRVLRERAETAAASAAALPTFHPLWYQKASREDYDAEVKPRHNALQPIALDALVHGDGESIRRLDALIGLLCDEPTWAVPWHDGDPYNPAAALELETAELGQDIALALLICEKRLMSATVKKAWKTLRERVIEPYRSERLWANAWDRGDNWTAVLHGAASVVATCASHSKYGPTLCANELEADRIRSTARGAFQNYFATAYTSDGYCLEGASYWSFGFGAWMNTCEVLERLGHIASEPHYGPPARAASFGVNMAGQSGLAPAFGDCIEGYRFPFDLCERASARYGLPLPEWGIQQRFASFVSGVCWLFADPSPLANSKVRTSPPVGKLYEKAARLRTITPQNEAFEVVVQAYTATGLAHDQNAVGTWAAHMGTRVVAGDPGYPKPYKGQFGKNRFDEPANSAAGHPVVFLTIDGEPKPHNEQGWVPRFEATKDEILFVTQGLPSSGIDWHRSIRIVDNMLEIVDRCSVAMELSPEQKLFTSYVFPDSTDFKPGPTLREIAPPSGFKGGRRWYARDTRLRKSDLPGEWRASTRIPIHTG